MGPFDVAIFFRRACLAGFLAAFITGCSDDAGARPLASAADLERLSDWQSLPIPSDRRYAFASSYDRQMGADAPLPVLEHGNRDTSNFLCKGRDTEDAVGILPPWTEEDTCAEDYVEGYVMARFEGTGTMTRLWIGALDLSRARLKIWRDGDPEPVIDAFLLDIHGGSEEMFAAPFADRDDSSFTWSYPISFEEKLIVALDDLNSVSSYWHQTSVVLAAERAQSDGSLAEAEEAAAERLADTAAKSGSGLEELAAVDVDLPAGGTVPVASVDGPGTIHRLWIDVDEAEAPKLQDVTLTARWDGAAEAAISAPVALLLGLPFGEPPDAGSLALRSQVSDGRYAVELHLPMPFESAEVTLTSMAGERVAFRMALYGDREEPPDGAGRLHVQVRDTTGPTDQPHPIAEISGRGRYVGTCLAMEGYASERVGGLSSQPLNFLEGDELGVIDGQDVLKGTGTEDYFNSSFYFTRGSFGSPFAQAWSIAEMPQADPPEGRVAACRWHALLDAIDFQSGFSLRMEIGGDEPSLLKRYRSAAFFYQ